ncbi:DHH family phosphoesterase [Nakamurella sp.]|uniref:DHH family phosphoesterase n=1 Tax=Nakamurella sp. TaxID=1869182 RepID=UPI003B3B20E2
MTDIRTSRNRTRGGRVRLSPAKSDAAPAGTPIDDLDIAAGLLAAARSVVLVAHVHPDADALGSALGLGLGLARRGVDVQVSFAEPDSVPESLRHLPGLPLVVAPEDVSDGADLFVSLDVGSRERLGSLVRVMDGCPLSLVIDHHASNARFGRYNLIDIAAEATAVLVARLLDRLGIPIDRDIAENLYAGLATDTGHFRHADAEVHRLAARLIDTGVRPMDVLHPITDSHPFGWLGMLSRVLDRAGLDRDAARGGGLVWTIIDDAVRDGLRQEELDSVIDILRTAQEAEVAMVIKQTGADVWQVSLRSRSSVDVAAAAEALGGGGHVRSAGFTHLGPPEDAVRRLREVIDR